MSIFSQFSAYVHLLFAQTNGCVMFCRTDLDISFLRSSVSNQRLRIFGYRLKFYVGRQYSLFSIDRFGVALRIAIGVTQPGRCWSTVVLACLGTLKPSGGR